MKVVEIFNSIEGESFNSGKLTTFVRFAGCNLMCSYCDTRWANEPNIKVDDMSIDEIADKLRNATNVTLTGGEPLLQTEMKQFLSRLHKISNCNVNIETNGTILIKQFENLSLRKQGRLRFSMDYKIGQGFEIQNLLYLHSEDALKFVISSPENFKDFVRFWKTNLQNSSFDIYLSPCFGRRTAAMIVKKMKEFSETLFGATRFKFESKVKLQLQIHKYIWNPEKRGV